MEPRSGAALLAGAIVAMAGIAAYALALDRLRRTLRERPSVWWGSNLRDLVNLGGLVALVGGCWTFGFPPPTAVLLGTLLCFSVYGLDYMAAIPLGLARPPAAVVPASMLLTAPVLLFADDVAPAVAAMLRHLFA